MPNPVTNRRIILTSPTVRYNWLTVDYASRAGITNEVELAAINQFTRSILSSPTIYASLQNGFVYLVSPTSYGASLHNLMSSSYLITTGVAPSFSSNGWAFNGTTTYLRTGLVPSTVMTLNTGLIAVYSRTNSQSSTFPIAASNTTGTTQWGLSLRGITDLVSFNAYNAPSLTGANTNSSGTFIASLTSSTTRTVTRNGTTIASGGTAAGTLPAFELYIGARNLNGTAGTFTPYEIATVINGLVGLSGADQALLLSYINTYNANVISGGR